MTQMRKFKPMDTSGVYRLGVETAMQGRDIDAIFNNTDLYGHVFVGPYVFHDPLQTLVAVDEFGVSAYMAISQDVQKMEGWAGRNWWPLLQEQYIRGAANYTPFEETLVQMLHDPSLTPADIAENYPVKVDIRVGERLEHHDSVEQLLSHCLDQQWARGVKGLHTDIPVSDTATQEIFKEAGFVEDKSVVSHIRMVRSLV